PPVERPNHRLLAAHADREVRRALTAALEASHPSLDDPVLERVEADHRDTSSRAEHLERGRQRCLQGAEFVVDGDPQRLEDTLRRMTVAEAGRRRDGGADRLDEVAGPLERLGPAPAADRSRDLARVALLPEAAEDRLELPLGRLVDE